MTAVGADIVAGAKTSSVFDDAPSDGASDAPSEGASAATSDAAVAPYGAMR